MSYVKQNFVDGQTLTAAQLNHMEAGIAATTGVKGEKGLRVRQARRAIRATRARE